MPIRYSDDDYRRHDNEDYSFVLRPDSSRDFARRRRFGTEDDDFGQVMSQVSSPLRLPQLGKPQRQRRPAYESYTQEYSPSRRTCSQRDISSVPSRRHKMSGAARQALALCGELDEDDAYYKARRNLMAQTPESFEEDDYSEKYFSSKQRNRPASSRDYWEDEEEEDPPRRQKSKISIRSQAEIKKEQNPVSRKRDYDDDVGYVVPSPRSRPDDVLAEEQPALREITSYMAKRKQFAVEDDEDIQKIKNKKYQYRTRGPYKQSYDTADDTDSRNRRFAQAPMFDMKLRSHVVWEKMYVKFTCTIRGNPDPKVTWYHNMVAIEPSMLHPGTMKISSQFGVHTLEIFQARLEDSGTYRVSAQNHKGEISSYATLLVRRYDGGKAGYYDVRSGYNIRKPTDYPDVEKLDVPDSNDVGAINEKEEDQSKKKRAGAVYSSKSVEVGDGKYESVLEFHIPGKHQALEAKRYSLQESTIEPIKLCNDQLETTLEEDRQSNALDNDAKQIEEDIMPVQASRNQTETENLDKTGTVGTPTSKGKKLEELSHCISFSLVESSPASSTQKVKVDAVVNESVTKVDRLLHDSGNECAENAVQEEM